MCPTCHRPTSPATLARYGGVCTRCHNRQRYVAQPVGYRCDCWTASFPGREHDSDCLSRRAHRFPGYVRHVAADAEYLAQQADYLAQESGSGM